jgi:hypothetical protein
MIHISFRRRVSESSFCRRVLECFRESNCTEPLPCFLFLGFLGFCQWLAIFTFVLVLWGPVPFGSLFRFMHVNDRFLFGCPLFIAFGFLACWFRRSSVGFLCLFSLVFFLLLVSFVLFFFVAFARILA